MGRATSFQKQGMGSFRLLASVIALDALPPAGTSHLHPIRHPFTPTLDDPFVVQCGVVIGRHSRNRQVPEPLPKQNTSQFTRIHFFTIADARS
ncbi:hypothetical protein PAXRUDRAFT_834344 [Paxillus rubicundulus Ve08.2h10]|uniref:Uncharacterized protein n=1 Tax=Paxillus rubicundulus Ve08.2h10 TaxID=930991 RepID=A0A0D0C7R1_9AGAM|nr:hypothetical protein PAXRUDRAFT_834344 [Paxillus rubicundulus Ve08.2h10]